jgi:glycosyltransferase involved in cell wall biosynthesis
VIATATGGIVDMIADGESGLLIPPGDAGKLSAAMDRLLKDAGLRARLAIGARERVGRFTASSVAERLEAVYARVAPRNPGTGQETCRPATGRP